MLATAELNSTQKPKMRGNIPDKFRNRLEFHASEIKAKQDKPFTKDINKQVTSLPPKTLPKQEDSGNMVKKTPKIAELD